MKSPENTKQSTFNFTGNSHVHLKFRRIFHRSSSVHQNLPNIFPKCSQSFDLHHFFWLKHWNVSIFPGFSPRLPPSPRHQLPGCQWGALIPGPCLVHLGCFNGLMMGESWENLRKIWEKHSDISKTTVLPDCSNIFPENMGLSHHLSNFLGKWWDTFTW